MRIRAVRFGTAIKFGKYEGTFFEEEKGFAIFLMRNMSTVVIADKKDIKTTVITSTANVSYMAPHESELEPLLKGLIKKKKPEPEPVEEEVEVEEDVEEVD